MWGRGGAQRLMNDRLRTSLVVQACLVAQLWLTLCDPMGCIPPGSTIHGISQARILEWVAISFSRRYSWPRDQTQVSCIAGGFCTIWASKESLVVHWLRILLPMQGIQAWSLFQEDSTCQGATNPLSWALLPFEGNTRSHLNEKPSHCSEE